MSIRRTALGGIVLLLFIGLSPGLAAQDAPAAEAGMKCGDCHEQVQAFVGNPHALGKAHDGGLPNAVCESCHGDGTAHMEAGGDPTLIKVPRGFEGADETCLACHGQTTERRSHRMGAHANSQAVNCLTCHSIHHAAVQQDLLVQPQLALCSNCHGTQAASFRNKPYTHRLGGAALTCSSCHDPHARPGRENLRVTTSGEVVCLSCHGEKRGPFVFNHGGVAGGESDCSTCHEPHGSNNPNQLRRATVAQVCMECHSPLTPDTLGSQPPSFHNLRLPRYQNCTTCHVAVHGSNRSPQLLK